ncbi:MAG: hypothetical protein ACYS76_14205 [Planctomycetota bacterium]
MWLNGGLGGMYYCV